VVIISQKAFNDDMGRYLDDLRKKKPVSIMERVSFFKQTNETVPDISATEVHVEYKEPSFFRKLFAWKRKAKIDEEDLTLEEKNELEAMEGEIEAFEAEESELEALEEEIEEKRESLLVNFFRKLNFFKRKNHQEEEYVEGFDSSEFEEPKKPKLNEDVKEVLKIAHSWIDKLGPRYKKAFKDSDDFKKYKEILTQYDLVKATEEVPKEKIENKPKT